VRERLTEIGFEHVTLDLEGYRTGSVSPEDEGESGTGADDAAEDEPLVEDVFAADYPGGS